MIKSISKILIKTKYIDNYQKLANSLCDNYKIINSSQIFHDEQSNNFEGYIEVENNLSDEFTLKKINSLKSNLPPSTQIEINLSTVKDNFDLSTKKKFSIFNNNKIVGRIVPVRLYHDDKKSDLKNIDSLMNHDYGCVHDKLEENSQFYEIIQIQAEPDFGTIADEFKEMNRIKRFIEIIKSSEILQNKLICIKSKQYKVIEKSLLEGVNFISDPGFDPKILSIVGESKIPYIFNAFSNIDNVSMTQSPTFRLAPYKLFTENVKRRLEICSSKNILNSNIAIDLNLNLFNRKFAHDILKNFSLIKQDLKNILISSVNIDLKNFEIVDSPSILTKKDLIKFLLSSGINIIRYDSINEIKHVVNDINLAESSGNVENIANMNLNFSNNLRILSAN